MGRDYPSFVSSFSVIRVVFSSLSCMMSSSYNRESGKGTRERPFYKSFSVVQNSRNSFVFIPQIGRFAFFFEIYAIFSAFNILSLLYRKLLLMRNVFLLFRLDSVVMFPKYVYHHFLRFQALCQARELRNWDLSPQLFNFNHQIPYFFT